ncbi:MAG: phosphate acyltransferase PlsX [Oscillospiraceae bacterium]|nr:phosphate acyltransferase PlsX [Oscillospiraceae bacterium]
MKILIDAMGGDNAPDAVIKGAVEAIKEIDSEIILVGQEEVINKKVKEICDVEKLSDISSKLKIKHATEVIEMGEIPTQAIRSKKDSSMVVGFDMLNKNEGDVFISAGNTGALLTGATLLVGRIKGIDRPAITTMLPSEAHGFLLIDAGSNTNCRPINLIQFAQMASIYLSDACEIKSPRIGLLNIGTEENKGNELVKETFQELKQNSDKYGINFVGSIEARDVFSGAIDALITDGFTGNVFLKTMEGMGKLVKKNLTKSLKRNILSMIASIPTLPAIKRFAKTMDYREYGGALFLGVKRPVVKAHGSSDEYSFYCTIKQAEAFAKSKAVEHLGRGYL